MFAVNFTVARFFLNQTFDGFGALSDFRYEVRITAYPVKSAAMLGYMYTQLPILQHILR